MKKCSVCSRVFDDSQSFCLDDGTALVSDFTLNSAETVLMTRKRSKLPFIFVGIFALLSVGLLAAWLVFQRTYSDASTQRSVTNVLPVSTPIQTVKTTAAPAPSPSPELTVSSEIGETPIANSDTLSVSKIPDENDPTKSPPIMKTEDHFVLFNLHQCRKSGGSITCDFTFTNKGPDRKFRFVIFRSNLFDELGNTYNGKNGKLASVEDNNPQITFVSGVTTKAQMTFDRIQENAVKITLLRIQYDIGDDYGLEIKFRNVPLLIPK